MSNAYQTIIPVTIADDDWFLSQSLAAAGTATSFSHSGTSFLWPQRIALSQNHTSTISVTMVYRTPWEPDVDFTETITVAASNTVTYTTYPAIYLTSVTYPLQAGCTLKVGFQGYPYYYVGDFSHAEIIGAGFMDTYVASTGTTGAMTAVTKGTAGTPAANTVGYDSGSRCVHYCYPVDGSSNAMAGLLVINRK